MDVEEKIKKIHELCEEITEKHKNPAPRCYLSDKEDLIAGASLFRGWSAVIATESCNEFILMLIEALRKEAQEDGKFDEEYIDFVIGALEKYDPPRYLIETTQLRNDLELIDKTARLSLYVFHEHNPGKISLEPIFDQIMEKLFLAQNIHCQNQVKEARIMLNQLMNPAILQIGPRYGEEE